MFIHSILQHYYVDGQEGVLNPVGMLGEQLEADFHIIHGIGTRVKNAVRCVKENPLEVEDVVFNPLAAAQVVLNQHQKNLGALAIDIGGGTTDYLMYVDGAVRQSGSLWHRRRSHHQRYLHGPAHPDGARGETEGRGRQRNPRQLRCPARPSRSRMTRLRRQGSRARDAQHHHPHAGARELRAADGANSRGAICIYTGAGIFITGGSSLLRGIDHLAQEIFELPVHIPHAQTMSGLTSAFENPQFSTAIGLIKCYRRCRPTGHGAGLEFLESSSAECGNAKLNIMIQLSHNCSLPEREREESRSKLSVWEAPGRTRSIASCSMDGEGGHDCDQHRCAIAGRLGGGAQGSAWKNEHAWTWNRRRSGSGISGGHGIGS